VSWKEQVAGCEEVYFQNEFRVHDLGPWIWHVPAFITFASSDPLLDDLQICLLATDVVSLGAAIWLQCPCLQRCLCRACSVV
jgi:hypothetical protein